MWKCLIFAGVVSALVACASPPPPQAAIEPKPRQLDNPSAALEPVAMEAVNINRIAAHFRLTINNPRSPALDIKIKNWEGRLNGIPLDERTAVLNAGNTAAPLAVLSAEPQSQAEYTLTLYFDLNDDDECLAELSLDLDYHYEHHDAIPDKVSAQFTFPRIREPEFTITAITILQADLINTRLKLGMKINNPNVFPVTLSSFHYELYGDGNFWADGTEKELSLIPANSSAETSINIEMNFIGMRRRILDDIIAMRNVYYRIAGNVEVGTNIPWLPVFRKNFDLSGYSAVTK